jgi:hypothetical protein
MSTSESDYRRVLEEHLAQVDVELAERRRAATPGGERPGFGKRATPWPSPPPPSGAPST